MSIGYELKIEGEGETKSKLEKLYRETTVPGELHSRIAKAAADTVKEHLQRRDSTHANKMGGRRSHFYWNAAQTVRGIPTSDGAEVVIDYLGLRQRWLGGDIYPVNAKYLAIPARAESYGIAPKDFPGDLTFVRFRSGAMALVADVTTQTVDSYGNFVERSAARGERKSRSKKVGLVEYWLKDHVYQRPDPDVLPRPEELLQSVTEATGEYLMQREQ